MQTLRDWALIGIFLIVVCLPALLAGLPGKELGGHLEEKRRLAERPGFPKNIAATKAFPHRFEAYFNDHFQLRDTLIRSHNWLKIKLLKRSPQRDVLMGRDGWFFYARNHLLEDFFGLDPFSEEDLKDRQYILESKRDWLKARGIPYFLVVAPNKQSIYPEKMPEGYDRSQRPSYLDQLLEYMRIHSDVPIVDLRADLIAAKASGSVYFKADTHWNPKGAFIAYKKIIDVLQEAFHDHDMAPRALADYRRVEAYGGDDLAKMLGIEEDVKEAYDRFEPLFTPCTRQVALPNYLNHNWKPFPEPVALHCSSANLRLVMLHDSFGYRLRPYISEHFQRSVFIHQPHLPGKVFKAAVLKENPDIVLEEVVERGIFYLKSDPEYLP